MGAPDPGHQHSREPSAETASGEVLWTLEKHGRVIECRLLFDPETGPEVQIRRSGGLSIVRGFDALARALAHANALLHDLCANGWQMPAGTTPNTPDVARRESLVDAAMPALPRH
jgi:hypothetical protein